MTAARKGAVGKQNNLADRKLTSRINGSNNKGAAQVLVVLDGNQRNGKKKRIMDTLKRLRCSKNRVGASTFKPKQQQENGIVTITTGDQ